jgi:hypothetical protein
VQSGANQFDVLEYWYATLGSLAENGVLTDVTGLIQRDEVKFALQTLFPRSTILTRCVGQMAVASLTGVIPIYLVSVLFQRWLVSGLANASAGLIQVGSSNQTVV